MLYNIREIVNQALHTGYLTLEAEEQLRFLLRSKYSWEDLNAFMSLQQAAMSGQVRQESREMRIMQQQAYSTSNAS
ncbi:hypothetical protein H6G20_25530 [Desertifilum sp. FACHB-1129]|uniref:Uncharacterized protein n=2 Tax=Desertifilum tharense IPPAS B-1220 TaxID=1781255 RepID=A0A1E5QEG7_9CYAN|nr:MULTISPECIES: hypothetical protein [Desertifilum]MCD8486999.1 hypothetical protein [Desertifilum sp.]MDA0211517.1 hypothetical protein [Cyanobacteria bacterium FC1]MBD2315033.1 hypothetical protein [Desertifilum sp. FACHB-1129]MBD2324703.1 hypothetical protein [Desertifilum sp. FACHB-866]MBD2334741.1 hypothetical protein [Desertifilum sp. FACHB-868]